MASHIARLYSEESLYPSKQHFLSEKHTHHLQHVLRMREKEKLFIFNNIDGEFEAEYYSQKKHLHAAHIILKQRHTPPPPPLSYSLTLCFGILKNPNAMHFLIEKATELGVTDFQPLLTNHSTRSCDPGEKWKNYAIAAIEQSKRMRLPVFHPLLPYDAWIEKTLTVPGMYVCAEESNQGCISLKQALSSQQGPTSISICIGPEGGFSEKERAILHQHSHLTCVTLGEAILRAETAALAMVSYCKFHMENGE